MKINCNIADDLLPLYIDESCSPDSKTAIESHLQECQVCREKLARMRGDDLIHPVEEKVIEPQLINYGKKIKRHRIRVAVMVTALAIVAAIVLALGYLTVQDMHRKANPIVYKVEEGIINLTAGDFETTAEKVNEYVFYTNYTQIEVKVNSQEKVEGKIILCNEENVEGLYGKITENKRSCTFTALSAACHYKIKCDELDGATIVVSEGREVSVWSSLKSVLGDIINLL